MNLPHIDRSESRINDVITKMAQYTIKENFSADDLTAANLEKISEDLVIRQFCRAHAQEKPTTDNDLLFTGSESRTALNIFHINEPEIDKYIVRIKCQRLRIAFDILNRLYRDRCARIIAHAWDRYWYRPNENGESKAAKVNCGKFVEN